MSMKEFDKSGKELMINCDRFLIFICILMALTSLYMRGEEIMFRSLHQIDSEMFSHIGAIAIGLINV